MRKTSQGVGLVLPALEYLWLAEISGSARPDGVQRLVEGLVAGALPAVTLLNINNMHVGDAGASAHAAALDRGALPRLNAQGPSADGHRHRQSGAGCPRAGLAAAVRAAWSISTSNTQPLSQPVRRRGPRRPLVLRSAAACRHAVAADGRAEEAQGARPRLHPGHRRWVRRPRRAPRSRPRRAACSREDLS